MYVTAKADFFHCIEVIFCGTQRCWSDDWQQVVWLKLQRLSFHFNNMQIADIMYLKITIGVAQITKSFIPFMQIVGVILQTKRF